MAAQKFLTLVNGLKNLVAAIQSSAGAGDAGKIVALDESGKLDPTMMPNGVGADTAVLPVSENLSAGDQVNIWDDSGTVKVRKADATAAGKEADGFVSASVTSGNNATVYFDGTITGLSSLTPGAIYFLSTSAGGIVSTAPNSGGNVVQTVGKAKSATELVFERGEPITIA